MYMRRRFSTVDESDNVGMMKAFEDFDFAVEVVFEFLVKLH